MKTKLAWLSILIGWTLTAVAAFSYGYFQGMVYGWKGW